MTDLLERDLSLLADRLAIDTSDRLVRAVLDRIITDERARHPRRGRVVVASVVAALVAVFAVPQTRGAIARWFGIGSTRIERVPVLITTTTAEAGQDTSAEPGVSSSAGTSAPPGATEATIDSTAYEDELGLGDLVTPAEATQQSGLPVPLLTGHGDAIGVYVEGAGDPTQVIVVYAPSPLLPRTSVAGVGALLSAMHGAVDRGYFVKYAGPDTVVENVQVETATGSIVDGIWLGGAAHEYLVTDPSGAVQPETVRLAGNTLLWQVGDVVYRLESALDRDAALAAARTVAG